MLDDRTESQVSLTKLILTSKVFHHAKYLKGSSQRSGNPTLSMSLQ